MLAARITRDTKMRPAKRRAQFDTTISPIIDPEGAVKQIYCAILCDLVRIGEGAGFKPAPTDEAPWNPVGANWCIRGWVV